MVTLICSYFQLGEVPSIVSPKATQGLAIFSFNLRHLLLWALLDHGLEGKEDDPGLPKVIIDENEEVERSSPRCRLDWSGEVSVQKLKWSIGSQGRMFRTMRQFRVGLPTTLSSRLPMWSPNLFSIQTIPSFFGQSKRMLGCPIFCKLNRSTCKSGAKSASNKSICAITPASISHSIFVSP